MQEIESTVNGLPADDLSSAKASSAEMLAVLSDGLPTLHGYARRLLRNEADAEDAVQDALLSALTHLNQFRGEAQFSTWLTTIVINCVRMQLRKRLRYTHVSLDSVMGDEHEHPLADSLVDPRPSPEEECHRSILHARMIAVVAELSPILRKTFHLRFARHLSIRETARVLGVPAGTVKAQSARARAKLLKAMRTRPPRAQRKKHAAQPRSSRQSGSMAAAIKAYSY